MKAMILAAGLGTRLRPLTHVIPKPLIPLFNVPLIRYTLETLKKAKITHVIVNLHHLPKILKQYLKSQKDFKISFSYEPQILGTGGGILKAKSFFKQKHFIVMNSDIIMDIDLKKVIQFHIQKKALATMVLRKLKPHESYDAIGLGKDGRILQFKSQNIKPPLLKTLFTGVHIFEPEIFEYFPKNRKNFCINEDVYTQLIKKGLSIYGFLHKGFWYDIGSVDLYFKYLKSSQFKRNLLKFFPGTIFPKTTG